MIEVEKLNFTYAKADVPALEDVCFDVQRGEIFGFLGPSGAGKSTTQKILIGLLKGFQGRVTVLGKDLSGWKSEYYERIGVSFELPNHFLKLTAIENLAYFSSLYRRPTHTPQAVLELVGLHEDGDRRVGEYSKGMKSRLNVARALLHDPDVLFLDEPTSGQDPVNARRLKELIKAQQHAGKTIFLTTHDMAVADELCDRVALIVDGRIKLIDAPRTLKLQYGHPSVRVEYQANSHQERAEFALAGLDRNDAFLSILREDNVLTIHSQEATLEDVFIRATGRSLL